MTKIVLLGPSLTAVSGISTHLNQLLGSSLANQLKLLHFLAGSEGRREGAAQKLMRLVLSPVSFAVFLLRLRPQIVHINTALVPKSYWRDIAYLLVARLLRCKVVYQVHGGHLPDALFAGNALLTGLLRRVLAMPDVVVLLAQAELVAYRKFVPEQRLEVIANAIDATPLLSEPIHFKAGTPLHLAYLGRLTETKGIFESVEALAILIRQGRDLHLSIAGAGPDEVRLKSRVTELGLGKRVNFLGPLYGEAKDALWRQSDVFTFPTYHWEGLPYALLEAMSAGAVPVTTRVAAIPDVMDDGVHGLLVEPRDSAALASALAHLDDDRAGLAQMAEAGRSRVLEAYTVDRMADDFLRLYASLAERAEPSM